LLLYRHPVMVLISSCGMWSSTVDQQTSEKQKSASAAQA